MDPEHLRRARQRAQQWTAWKQTTEDQAARARFQQLVVELHRELAVATGVDEWERELLTAWDEARRRYRNQESPHEGLVQLLQRAFEDFEAAADEARSLQDQPMQTEFLVEDWLERAEQTRRSAGDIDPVAVAEDIVAGKEELESADQVAAAGVELGLTAQNELRQRLRDAIEFYRIRMG